MLGTFCFRPKCRSATSQHATGCSVSDATDHTSSGSNLNSKWTDSVSDHSLPCAGICYSNSQYHSGIQQSDADDTTVESGVCVCVKMSLSQISCGLYVRNIYYIVVLNSDSVFFDCTVKYWHQVVSR
jgi:hypothetical protein